MFFSSVVFLIGATYVQWRICTTSLTVQQYGFCEEVLRDDCAHINAAIPTHEVVLIPEDVVQVVIVQPLR